jgi:AraC family transcriptional regulator
MEAHFSHEDFPGDVIRSREVAGLSLLEGIYKPEARVPSHSHDEAFFCIALSGGCEETYAGRSRTYDLFSAEFLPANHSHSLTFSPAKTRAFSVALGSEWLKQAGEYSLKLDQSVFGGPGLSSLFLRLYKEFLMEDTAAPIAIEGLLLQMLSEVSRRNAEDVERQPPRWFRYVIELLHNSFQERLTMTQIAATAGIHPVHLARQFQRFKNCTVGDYIRDLRIQHACHQLANSEESPASIGAAAGFADQSHFCRTFKRLVGITPVQYREEFMRNRKQQRL